MSQHEQHLNRGRGQETKPFSRTSEFWVFVVTALAILIAGATISGEGDRADVFAADKIWLYITILAATYLLSRGIAKAGTRDPVADHDTGHNHDHAPIGERFKAAAKVLTDGPDATHRDRDPDHDDMARTTRQPAARTPDERY